MDGPLADSELADLANHLIACPMCAQVFSEFNGEWLEQWIKNIKEGSLVREGGEILSGMMPLLSATH